MFKFNFPYNGDQIETEGREIEMSSYHRESVQQYRDNCCPTTTVGEFHLLDFKHIEKLVTSQQSGKFESLNSVLQMNSDLLTGVYEGGLKIWECTLDLLEYFEKENIKFQGLNVLDLGCGAGLLGIYALSRGASSVHFQDYNAEVLDLVTIPNVILNGNPEMTGKTRFFAGDWGSLAQMLKNYDIVLTSETIYNPENYSKLLKVFQETTKKSGVIYVAAKHHYFGVGGSLFEFEKLLRQNERWETSICFCSNEGVKREILKVFHNK
uniref:protein-histidine N-methyltransferase n=1 Tax=Ceriodaphnia reticulata TaxID=302197 RepID=A0A4Y7LXP8_9CRUS|nr:EOG090X0C09 [Ceriodaphnia reticulata]